MFERFTDRARRVVVLAQEESRLLNHNYIGTEHILLGLVHEGEGVGAKALEELGISLNRARERVLEIIGQGGSAPSGHIPFTPRAKKVLELSLREALQLGHNYIGTEHILLGLIREGEGVGAQVLIKMGADLSTVRTKVIELLSGYSGGQPPSQGPTLGFATRGSTAQPHLASGTGGACSFCGRDLWEVDQYVTASRVVICAECIEAARRAIDEAPESAARGLALPPRVFGDPAPQPDAAERVHESLRRVFGGGDDEDVTQLIEGGEQLSSVRAEVRRRFPQVVEPSISLDRVRFHGTVDAEVRFTISLGGGGGGPTVDGRMMFSDGQWQVARETFCDVMQMAGVTCPPPEQAA